MRIAAIALAAGIVAVTAALALQPSGEHPLSEARHAESGPNSERASLAAMRASQPAFGMLEGEVSLRSISDASGRGTFNSAGRLDTAIAAAATAHEVRLRRVDCVAGRRASDHREFFCALVFVDGSEGQTIARISLDGRRWRLGPMRLE
jgi:hypothetical protein